MPTLIGAMIKSNEDKSSRVMAPRLRRGGTDCSTNELVSYEFLAFVLSQLLREQACLSTCSGSLTTAHRGTQRGPQERGMENYCNRNSFIFEP